MNKIIILVLALFVAEASFAQIKDPVKWTAASRKNGANTEVVLTAVLPKPWHIYSQHTGQGGPLPTAVKFNNNPLVSLVGPVKEIGKLKEEYDSNFDTKVKYYADKVEFVQVVKLKANVKTNLNVSVEYMICDDSQCLPPTKKTFAVSL